MGSLTVSKAFERSSITLDPILGLKYHHANLGSCNKLSKEIMHHCYQLSLTKIASSKAIVEGGHDLISFKVV